MKMKLKVKQVKYLAKFYEENESTCITCITFKVYRRQSRITESTRNFFPQPLKDTTARFITLFTHFFTIFLFFTFTFFFLLVVILFHLTFLIWRFNSTTLINFLQTSTASIFLFLFPFLFFFQNRYDNLNVGNLPPFFLSSKCFGLIYQKSSKKFFNKSLIPRYNHAFRNRWKLNV